MPADKFVLDAEVSVAFSDEEIGEHEREQATALKALYLSSATDVAPGCRLKVEQSDDSDNKRVQFIVKRGLQVVGVASYSESTGQLTDVAIRPTAGDQAGATLMDSVRQHARKIGRSSSLVVYPRSDDNRELFESMGFSEVKEKMISPLE